MESNLIFDIGANNGDDSAYYLRRGYRVAAVEANPGMVERMRCRFPRELAAGTLALLSVGIAAEDGEFDYWVSDDVPDWSSFNRSIASRKNARHHKVTIQTRKFGNILTRYGIPFYCKIDIEGNDGLCLQDMHPDTLPPYVSVELSPEEGDIHLARLKELGYRKFKVVSQVTRAQPMPALTALNFRLPRRARKLVMRVDRWLRGAYAEGDWRFPHFSSGPFGEHTPGQWHDFETAPAIWKRLRDLDFRHQTGGIGSDDWHDIPAAL